MRPCMLFLKVELVGGCLSLKGQKQKHSMVPWGQNVCSIAGMLCRSQDFARCMALTEALWVLRGMYQVPMSRSYRRTNSNLQAASQILQFCLLVLQLCDAAL